MSILSTALDTYLKVARAPVDVVVGLRGGEGAELAVDRADANVRSLAATLLGDEALRADASRRHAAADKREEALRLRAQAERVEESGEERADRQRTAARRQRAQRTEQVEKRARRDRLDAVEQKAEALDRAEDALEAQDEAERLGQTAAKVKEQRKARTTNGSPAGGGQI